jgi:choline-glycine betaine transporter
MESHLRAIGILFIVRGVLGILASMGVALFGIAGGLGYFSNRSDPVDPYVGTMIVCIAGILFILSVAAIVVGCALYRLRPWARVVGIVLSLFELVTFCGWPLTLGLGVYGLIVLFQSETAALFSDQFPQKPDATL